MVVVYIILILLIIYIIFILFKSFPKNESMFGFNFMKYTLSPIFRFYYPFKMENEKVIPKKGPVILCGNHVHLMDQCLAIYPCKRSVHYMAKIEYFQNKKVSWFFRLVGCIPVNRSIHDEKAKKSAVDVLNKGLVLGIFPEGTRNRTKEILQPFKFGTVSLAKKTNATIIPFAITGTYKFRTKNLKITFGDPFKVDDMELEEANEYLYNTILDLIKKNTK